MTNYTQLPKVIEAYSSRGFEVLAFPCNQFNYGEKVCDITLNLDSIRVCFDSV